MAGIIKASGEQQLQPHARPAEYSFQDMAQKAEAYLEQVRGQASDILADAKVKASQLSAQAKIEARDAAVRSVEVTMRQELDSKLNSLMPALQAMLTELGHARHEWKSHWEKNLIDLAVSIAEKVIRDEVQQRPAITLNLIQEALELASGSGKITLHLHPDDREALGESVEALLAQLKHLGQVQVASDEQIEKGSCRVSTEYGSVDQQFTTQLDRIREELS